MIVLIIVIIEWQLNIQSDILLHAFFPGSTVANDSVGRATALDASWNVCPQPIIEFDLLTPDP